MNGLDLFSGIGGISIALSPWVKTVAYCECEPYAQAVLLERMASGDLDIAPIWDDVRTLNREILDTEIDIIFGGFPCQDISVAGNGAGLEGERSGLFFEIARLADEYRPRFIFLENVPAICTRGGVEVIETLTALGYECRWGVLSAFDVGAPHLRERWWCLAHASGKYDKSNKRGMDSAPKSTGEQKRRHGFDDSGSNVANAMRFGWIPRRAELQRFQGQSEITSGGDVRDTNGTRLEIRESCEDSHKQPSPFGANWWESEPDVDRVVNGLPYRVDRIKALGNSVVPQAAREAFCRLAGFGREIMQQ